METLNVTEHEIDLGRITLSVVEAGQGGMPLLLLHGFTGDNGNFEPLMAPLVERGWHVVAPDHRGHGKSAKPDSEDEYSIEIFVDDTLALVDRLGWDRFVMLGHSMGGMIAQVLAIRAPHRVRGLILLDTGHGRVDIDAGVIEIGVGLVREHGLDKLVDVTSQLDDPLATPAHKKLCAANPAYKQYLEDSTRRCSGAMFVAMMLEITHPHDRLGELGVIECPTLIIVGEQDAPFIEQTAAMAEAIPNARREVVAEAGHSPQFEAFDGFWSALAPFLDELAAASHETAA